MADQTTTSPETTPKSHSTNLTTPDDSPVNNHNHNNNNSDNDVDDTWASDSDYDHDDQASTQNINQHNNNIDTSPTQNTPQLTRHHQTTIQSDLPSLKRQHMTAGYREGLSIGKAKVMQSGFDAGYPIGIKIALRAGEVLGILEGSLAALSRSQQSGHRNSDPQGVDDKDYDSDGRIQKIAEIKKLYDKARTELACKALLDGIDDEVIYHADSENIPDRVEGVLRRWENLVFCSSEKEVT